MRKKGGKMWEAIVTILYIVKAFILAFCTVGSYLLLRELKAKLATCDQMKRIMFNELKAMQHKVDSVEQIPLPEELKQMIVDVENLKDEIDRICQKIKICQIRTKNNKVNK
jgi:hypothetical protein